MSKRAQYLEDKNPKINISVLSTILRDKPYDSCRMCYYPDIIDTKQSSYGPVQTKISSLSTTDIKRIVSNVTKLERDRATKVINTKGRYSEYGLRDTFARVSEITTDVIAEKHRSFFRRVSYKIVLSDVPGMFILELYLTCDEEELPVLAEYPHCVQCDVDTYIVESKDLALSVCLTTTKDTKNNTDDKTYLSIVKNLSDEIPDVSDRNFIRSITTMLERFFGDVQEFIESLNQ